MKTIVAPLALAFAALAGTAYAADLGAPTAPMATTSAAADGVQVEWGTRAWLGFGRTAKDLYSSDGSHLLSRLTYGGMPAGSAELFGKLRGEEFFVNAMVGFGSLSGGTLTDEDFPLSEPYSKTTGTESGSFGYATVDLGRYFYDTGDTMIGGFLGYNELNQSLNNFGCAQQASSTVCAPPISDEIKVISQLGIWQSVRVGISGEAKIDNRWSVSADAAYLPYVSLSAADTHWRRAVLPNPTPEDGTGWGAQVQAMVDYKVRDNFSLGIGGRYWHMQTSGQAHFEANSGVPQPLNFSTDLYGLLLEAKSSF